MSEIPSAALPDATLRAIRQAAQAARVEGRDPSVAARDVARAHHPALPATLIGEAVRAALQQSEAGAAGQMPG
jgi:predicted RecB family endonuclease